MKSVKKTLIFNEQSMYNKKNLFINAKTFLQHVIEIKY
jgi:hypothetical protein